MTRLEDSSVFNLCSKHHSCKHSSHVTLLDGRLSFGISNATQHIQHFSNAVLEIYEKVWLKHRPELHSLTLC